MAKERSRERVSELRKKAEKILDGKPQAIRTLSPVGIKKLIHELHVYQIELEMQNEELRRLQLELQGARDKYLNLYDFAPTGYFTLDTNGIIVDVNLTGSELLESEKHRLIGTQFTRFISPDSQDVFYFHRRQLLKTGTKGACELKMLKMDGTPFHAQLISTAISEEDGNINHYRTAVIDITERKQMEAQLMQADRLASVGELASGMAHEINNPLTSVIGFSQLVLDRDIPDDVKEDIKTIQSEAQRCAEVTKKLLSFARKHTLARQPLNVNDIILKTLEFRAYEQSVENIKVDCRIASDLPLVMADYFELQQVFLNIIINAEYFMIESHNRGTLTITTEKAKDMIRISFADDGPGIAEEHLEHLFDPFFTTKEVGKGTGLGLSICHGIVTQHGGRIWAESELGKGTKFTVELSVVTEDRGVEPPEVPAGEIQKATKAKILVVDDESAIRQFLSRMLANEGHEVKTMENAIDALTRLEGERYDLILADIKIPGMSGIEFYERIQKMDPSLAARVIFITGDVVGAGIKDFLSRTKLPYITKPLDIEELRKEVNRSLLHLQ